MHHGEPWTIDNYTKRLIAVKIKTNHSQRLICKKFARMSEQIELAIAHSFRR
jgi:hypothetical protein